MPDYYAKSSDNLAGPFPRYSDAIGALPQPSTVLIDLYTVATTGEQEAKRMLRHDPVLGSLFEWGRRFDARARSKQKMHCGNCGGALPNQCKCLAEIRAAIARDQVANAYANIAENTKGLRPGWYVATGFFWHWTCGVIAGPFTTQEDAE